MRHENGIAHINFAHLSSNHETFFVLRLCHVKDSIRLDHRKLSWYRWLLELLSVKIWTDLLQLMTFILLARAEVWISICTLEVESHMLDRRHRWRRHLW